MTISSIIKEFNSEDFTEYGIDEQYFDVCDQYKERIMELREEQKQLIRDDRAITGEGRQWNGSLAERQKMANLEKKSLLRLFNHSCAGYVVTIRRNNVKILEDEIRDLAETIGKAFKFHITSEYLQLKVDELYLVYECRLEQSEKER